MSDYIKREDAIKPFKAKEEYANRKADEGIATQWDAIAAGVSKATVIILEGIPPADVRPVVHVEWYGESDGDADGCPVYDIWSCPCCGKYFDEWDEKPTWNFCPNCGARMEVDSDA